jgi:hypothetical protein
MRVLVNGKSDPDLVAEALMTLPIDLVVIGGDSVIDRAASKWAEINKKHCLIFPTLFRKEGSAAVALRNVRMVEDAQPDLIILFPDYDKQFLSLAESRNIPFIEVKQKGKVDA